MSNDGELESSIALFTGRKLAVLGYCSKEKGESLANEYNMTFFETSALNGNGIQDVFQKCIETIDNRIKEGFYNLDSDKHGIKRIKKDNGNSLGGTIIDKKGLMEGGKSKNKKICCL